MLQMAFATPDLYCVIDLSAGAFASSYPVTYLSEPPAGGFNMDEYKTTKLVLRRIEPGTFMMCGQYETTLTKPYYIGIFEVTQRQYELVMGTKPSSQSWYAGDTRPMCELGYDRIRGSNLGAQWPTSSAVDANCFIGILQTRTNKPFDLPTEAQWEYACRAGTTSSFNNGGENDAYLNLVGRYSGNTDDGKGGYTRHTVVGSYQPNAWGLYDMHGNVMEICLDRYDANSLTNPQTDPIGPVSWGGSRVTRGGGYSSRAESCTSSYRIGTYHEGTSGSWGFRLALSVDEQSGGGEGGGQQGGGDNPGNGGGNDNPSGGGNDDPSGGEEETELQETINGVIWYYMVTNGEATIISTSAGRGDLTIPTSLGGYPVTSIGNEAFYGDLVLNSLIIPASIKEIEGGAFGWCYLTNVYFLGSCPAGCEDYQSWLFSASLSISYPQAYADTYTNAPAGKFAGYVDVAPRATATIAIPATNSAGAFVCSANAGELMKVQYLSGEWSLYYSWNTESPDSEELENNGKRAVIVNLDAPNVVLATLPANTASKPFFWVIPEDGNYALRIDDTDFGDNTGEVCYKVSVGELSIENGPASVTLAEALDNELEWTSGGSALWTAAEVSGRVGGLCIRSGEVGDSQSSWVETTIDGPGDISFSWKVSSQARLDRLTFTTDGETKAFIAGTTASVTNWADCSFTIEGRGMHTLRWTYAKSPSGTAGEDCGWLDNVQWNPCVPLVIDIPEALDALELEWTSGGNDAAAWEVVESPSYEGEDACAAFADGTGGLARIATEVIGPGTVSFRWSVESGTSFAGIAFMVDGEDVDYCENEEWSLFEYALSSGGTHTLAWEYFWDGVPDGDAGFLDCVSWVPVTSADPIPALAADATPSAVTNAIESANFANEAGVLAAIGGSATNYLALKTWAQGVAGGEAAVVASDHAAVSWLLGAETLFENEPEIQIAALSLADARGTGNQGSRIRGQGSGIAMSVTVVVKDGEEIALVDEEKVASMFEMTNDLGDWDGAAKLTPSVTNATRNPDGTMSFTVVPGDGTATRAFLRIKVALP